jgi:hypothetical protein
MGWKSTRRLLTRYSERSEGMTAESSVLNTAMLILEQLYIVYMGCGASQQHKIYPHG